MNPFVTPIQELQFYDKYSRWSQELGRRENWEETVERVISFFYDQLKKRKLPVDSETIPWNDLQNAMLLMEAMPSMRIVQMAGPALERCNVGAYNPVSGDTLVGTKEYGLIPISMLDGKTATVLNIMGRWAEAKFRGYGSQEVVECVFRPNKGNAIPTTVRATLDHRWVLCDGSVKATKQLKAGDRISFVAAPRSVDEQSIDYRLGVQHGIVYGDGTATYKQERNTGYHLRICSDHQDLLPWFKEYAITYPESCGGDPVVMIYGDFAKTHDLKALPSRHESDEYLVGFVRGWLAADGHVTTGGQVGLCASEREIKWFGYLYRLGYVVQRVDDLPAGTNYGERTKPSVVAHFFRSSMTADDFIVRRKRENFKPLETIYFFSGFGERSTADVYCAHVPDTNTFVLDRGLVTGNCAYLPIDSWDAFGELLYILMQGTGAGFSVEVDYVDSLPRIKRQKDGKPKKYIVPDTTEGWCSALTMGLKTWAAGEDVVYDFSRIRPQGTVLRTKGGRASGPEPLKQLLLFVRDKMLAAQGRRLDPIDAHDIACFCGQIVQVGGVRRAALISLSDLDDRDLREAKNGQFWLHNVQRAMANNSTVYDDRPKAAQFMEEWLALMKSGSGERGIFNRGGLAKQLPKRRKKVGEFGVNPCGEIILRPRQFCNLSIAIARPEDTQKSLARKVRLATIFGTLQSLLTDFKFISPKWRENCEEERLLGVDITGQMDCPALRPENDPDLESYRVKLLADLRQVAIDTNKEFAEKLGIPQSAAVTCIKPSGNSAQLFNCSSGLHPRYAKYYLRRLRIGAYTPIAKLLEDAGVSWFPEVGQTRDSATVRVVEFPVKSPDGAPTRHDLSAIEQLNNWLAWKLYYTEHNPSVTIYVSDEEWPSVGAWVYEHFDQIGGLSFLPKDGGVYELAPYEEIDQKEYERRTKTLPIIDFSKLPDYEKEDMTELQREFGCTGDKCEV